MCRMLFNDQRVVAAGLAVWTLLCVAVFLQIMIANGSAFLAMGPNSKTRLFNVPLDTWPKWWCVAVYTFVSTCIAAFASDSVATFIINTMQDHKTRYILFAKTTCLVIIQVWTTYAVIMGTISLFVTLTQIDFLIIRLIADLIINFMTTAYFLNDKICDVQLYRDWERNQKQLCEDLTFDEELINLPPSDRSLLCVPSPDRV